MKYGNSLKKNLMYDFSQNDTITIYPMLKLIFMLWLNKMKKMGLFLICFTIYTNIYSQASIIISGMNDFEDMIMFEADTYSYSREAGNLKIYFKVGEPKYLMIFFKTRTIAKLPFRIWVENATSRRIEYKDSSFRLLDTNWYELNEKIYSNRRNLGYSEDLVKTMIIDYIQDNVNFLSLYYLTHHSGALSREEFEKSYNKIQDFKYLYEKYPSYYELMKIADNKLSRLRKCQNTMDSFIDFEYIDSSNRILTTLNLNKKIIILYFSFIGCKACQISTPYLDSLFKLTERSAIDFLSFYMANKKEQVMLKNYYKLYEWHCGSDLEGASSNILNRYNIQAYPTLLVFKDRKLFKKLDDANMIKTIKDLNNP
jgi:thiol-disulfide isomerase/thioredoxin